MMPRAPHSTLRTHFADPRSARRARALTALSLIACAALTACAAADEDADSAPDFGSFTGGAPGTGGATGSPLSPPSGSAGAPAGSAGTRSEQVGGNGTPIASTGGTTGSNSGSNTGGTGNIGTGGTTNAGAGGSVSAGGSAQVDPNGAGGSTGTAGAPPNGAGGTAAQPPPAVGGDIACPAGASFCSGFESGVLPAGTEPHAVGPSGVDGAFTFESAGAFAGQFSLVVPATNSGGFFYRALAVPVPGQDFWVRLYMNVSTTFGDNSHDSLFGASSGALAADVNGEALVELSEQFNEVLLNTDDAVFNPPTTTTLPANTWLCMEAHYNGGTGDVEIFADGNEIVNAPGYRTVNYQTFRIGYMRYNDDRAVRYDDVIVAPARVGCQ
jgi:hypothetical protein